MKFSQQSGFSYEQISKETQKLTPYIEKLKQIVESSSYDLPEGSINLPFDEQILKSVQETVSTKTTSSLKYIVDIGIGGSNLGAKAVYDAFFGFFDVLEYERLPKILFADTNDPEFLSKLEKFLKEIPLKEQVLVNLISKSGGTTESVVNGEIILSALRSIDPNLERLVITSDNGSKLWNFAQEKGITTLDLPKNVGGRYSIMSAVGLFPLLATGINIENLRLGASDMVEKCLELNETNPALISSAIIYLSVQNGLNINDNFLFHSELESVGKWYRQLMAESLGKNNTKTPTPTVSVGSTDLHSMVQLYLGGNKDKVTTFVGTEKSKEDIQIPSEQIFTGLVDGLTGKKASDVMKAILEGVKIAYSKKGLPFMEVTFEQINEYELGQFFQFKMIEMMYLGQLFGVNAFDQPNVEDYKVETKKILNS